MVLHQREQGTLKNLTPRITELDYLLVDPPWNFYSIRYVLEDRAEHIVYIPTKNIATELETKNIVEIIVEKLRAKLDCKPVHVERVTKEAKDATKRRAIDATRISKARRLAKSTARD
jgi:AraC-like DNA-binding protein